jgi:predicted transcriptional regulator
MKYLNTKPGSIEEVAANMSKYATESEYQDMFKKELEKAGKGIGAMTPKEKKAFFNKIDSKYTAKDEETKINEISDKDKRDNLQKIKAINDMVADIPGVNNNEYKILVDLGKPLNYYENPRGATDAQKKYFTDFAKKFSNKMSFSDKREYEGYIKAVTEAVDNPYAVGVAQAMKAKDDQPPLKKSTITKAHDIAKSIEKDQKESVEMNEADITFYDLDSNDPSFKKLVRDNNLTVKSKRRGYKGDTITISGSNSSIEKALKTMYGNDWRKVYKQQGSKYIEAQFKKDIKEEDAYQNDRFAVSGNSAKIDNANTRDKSNHIYAPNAKTAVAMYKAGIKSYKDTADMRKKFPMAVEEVQEAVFDVRLNVDGAVDTSSVNSVVKMLKDKGIMAKVQPSERDGQAVTINSSASKNRVINVLGNIVDEEVQETHSFVTNKQNEKQKKVGGEKDIVDPAPSIKKESLYDSIKSVWQISAEEMDKIKSEAKYYKKEQNKNDLKPKKIADTGSKSTPVDVEPKVEI